MEYLFPFAENNSQNRHCLTGKPHKQGVFSHFLTIPKGEGNTNFSFYGEKSVMKSVETNQVKKYRIGKLHKPKEEKHESYNL